MIENNFHNRIQAPDLEARVAIVRNRAEQKKVVLSKDVAIYLAQNVELNTSALEDALTRLKGPFSRLKAHSSLIGTDVTLNYTKHVLSTFIAPHTRTVTVDPFQKMSLGQRAAKDADRTRQAAAAADRPSIFCLLETPEGRKIRRVREVLQVNMREREREQLAGRDVYERELERRAKKRKRG